MRVIDGGMHHHFGRIRQLGTKPLTQFPFPWCAIGIGTGERLVPKPKWWPLLHALDTFGAKKQVLPPITAGRTSFAGCSRVA